MTPRESWELLGSLLAIPGIIWLALGYLAAARERAAWRAVADGLGTQVVALVASNRRLEHENRVLKASLDWLWKLRSRRPPESAPDREVN